MITKATVIKTEGDRAYVRVMRKSACGGCEGCSAKGSCHTEFVLSDSPKTFELEVKNEIGAKTGDVVEIQSGGNSVLVLAFLVFIIPVAAAVFAYLVSEKYLSGNLPVVISSVGFIASFLLAAFVTDKLSPIFSKNYVSKIIKENSDGAGDTNVYKE